MKPVVMYGCETWKMNKCDGNKIDVFQRLRRIFKIHWQERIRPAQKKKSCRWLREETSARLAKERMDIHQPDYEERTK